MSDTGTRVTDGLTPTDSPGPRESPAPTDGELDVYADLAGTVLRLAREIRLREFHTREEVVVLPSSAVQVMQHVDAHPGASPSEVAEATGLQRTNTSTTLRQLVKIGFIEKRADPDDGRSIRLYSTEKAIANLSVIRHAWGAALHSVLGDTDGIVDATAMLGQVAEKLAADRRAVGLSTRWQ